MSFGLNVARMAGLPKQVLDRAKTKSVAFAIQLDKVTGKAQKKQYERRSAAGSEAGDQMVEY